MASTTRNALFVCTASGIKVPAAKGSPVDQGHDGLQFRENGGMHHFGGTASEQTDFRHTVAMKLDHRRGSLMAPIK
ncbi:hypothetical protein [Mesorhizobium sp. NZP2077]|uniref:hypothetical protein n=1 Tax=Mesorhizobium sp. NZP2077 TaxID=2483404 RepID=UPI001554962B|nr:hypothetical protein [Mesorhizobium sp. NZP2077]QKD13588.1 hypothetical protein HGP13_15010 [Mesorhizobium sp. NZP2077]